MRAGGGGGGGGGAARGGAAAGEQVAAPRVSAHVDSGLLTVLAHDHAAHAGGGEGLQLLLPPMPGSGRWRHVGAARGALIVQLGVRPHAPMTTWWRDCGCPTCVLFRHPSSGSYTEL